jgi:hypothetical protein
MNETLFSDLQTALEQGGVSQLLDRLIASLREQKEFHKLFDARLVRKKHSLGLSVARPTSLEGLTGDIRKEVEAEYIAAAREVGELFLAEGDIPSAWMYYQVIREKEPVANALRALPVKMESDGKLEQLIHIALYQQVLPERGVEWLLNRQGTCSTITTLDQAMQQLTIEQRNACAKVMVRHLYNDLCGNVRREVERKLAMLPPTNSLRELLFGRDWLFENGNYHIDVSHLNSIVRFARQLNPGDSELELALQLAEYGCKLEPRLQYPGEPPFEDFFAAHTQFFKVLLGQDQDAALDYFRKKLEQEPDEQDKPLLAYVLVDLLSRVDRVSEAVPLATQYLTRIGDDGLSSVAELCEEARAPDALADVAREQGNLVLWTIAKCMAQPR